MMKLILNLTLSSALSIAAHATEWKMDVGAAMNKDTVGRAADFVSIPGGTFTTLYLPVQDEGRTGMPEFTIEAFEIQSTPVTQLQYFLVIGKNMSAFSDKESCGNDAVTLTGAGRDLVRKSDRTNTGIIKVALCPRHPMDRVSYLGAIEFIKTLNDNSTDYTYDLPTAEQYEWAARAGTDTRYFFGNDTTKMKRYVWYTANSKGQTHEVATKLPNPWGLYDMAGNISQYTPYNSRTYYSGGSWNSTPYWIQRIDLVKSRDDFGQISERTINPTMGFRLVRYRREN